HYDALYYSVAKAGLDMYCKAACIELAQQGIRMNNVNPGWISTNILKRSGTSDAAQAKFEATWVKEMVPMQRSGTSEEIANVICFLASDEASFMTGSIVVADGGLICHSPSQKKWH
uniref:SDR family oxidoreductase n=1 Tax=Acrobeloides nanus TaxID=290746 RepID=A0A914DH78_9BILA